MANLSSDDFVKKCKVVNSDELGRYVIATTLIKPGETVLLERPALILPKTNDRRCSNCYKLTEKFCSKCQLFPLCDDCNHHDTRECERLIGLKGLNLPLLQQYKDIYVPLKCFLLRELNSEKDEAKSVYAALLALEAHLSKRRDTEVWENYQKNVIQPMREGGLLEQLTEIDEELIQRFFGIIDVNIFEIRAPEPGAAMGGLYLNGSLFAHSCLPNLVTAIDNENRLKVYANRFIAQGEILYNCYANVLLGTEERRRALMQGKYFHCECERCSDPTELGTHLSSFLCSTCAGNQQQVGNYIVKEPTTGSWQCLLCPEHTLKSEFVESVLERAKEEIFHAREDIYRQEILLTKLSRLLHNNHYLLLDLKQNIAAILRQVLQNMSMRPSRKVYERKIYMCQELLLVLKDLTPGISRLKSIALYELCDTQAELGRKMFAEGECNAEHLLRQLAQTEIMLREALRMLLYEPLGTQEGQLARTMIKELKELQADIKKLQETCNN